MRWWHKTLLILVILLSISAAAGNWYWRKMLQALPVQDLQFQIDSIGLHKLRLKDIHFTVEQPELKITLDTLTLNWQFPTLLRPSLNTLQLDTAHIILQRWPQTTDDTLQPPSPSSGITLPAHWQLPANLPQQLILNRLNLSLPCADTSCQYRLDAELAITAQHAKLQLLGYDNESGDNDNADRADADSNSAISNGADIVRLKLDAQLNVEHEQPALALALQLDDSVTLTLQQQLSLDTQSDMQQLTGDIALTIAPPSPWLQTQFSRWQQPLPQQALAQFTSPVTLQNSWQLSLPQQANLSQLAQYISGNWQLSAHLPSPLALPGIGLLQGDLNATMALRDGELEQYQLNAELDVHQPLLPDDVSKLGIAIDSVHLSLNSDGNGKPEINALPVNVELSSQGDTRVQFNSRARVNLTPPLSIMAEHNQLQLTQQQLIVEDKASLSGLTLHAGFSAYWLADNWQLTTQNLNLKAAKLSTNEAALSALSLDLAAGRVSGDALFSKITLAADIKASADTVSHAQLLPQPWHYNGKLAGELALPDNAMQPDVTLSGQLGNKAGLSLNQQLHYRANEITLNWQLGDIFLLAGNPFQQTFTDWPALLEFNRGRINANGELSLTDSLTLQASVNLSGVSGIYDRSLFKDLTLPLQLALAANQLSLSAKDMRLGELQQGITAGPLTLDASYQADMAAPTHGKLQLERLQLLAMGGQVWVAPTLLDLALPEQQLLLHLKQINLTQVLQQHPTTDLNGNGLISGTVPLNISRAGVTVTDGIIAAESPGGLLQYRPAAAQNMAAGNPGMKVLLDALNDFHYSVLESNVSYNQQGQLTLGLKLQGQNPALEAGRPINLTINLEEDIPAMITSLQLSSQISDKIKQRVQQRLQKSGSNTANGVKP